MSLDMYNFVDTTFNSPIDGGVYLNIPKSGGYTGVGGTWEDVGSPEKVELKFVSVQPVSLKIAEFYSSSDGGAVNPSDFRVLRVNDGTQIHPDDDGKFAHTIEFSDGNTVRVWRVRQADNRPWRNYCKVVVERYRGKR